MTASVPQMEPNLLVRAVANYSEMEEQLAEANRKIVELSIDNGSLTAEVNMLREELARADADRLRLQAVASTLNGELTAIKDVIDGSVRRALEAGVRVKAEPPRQEPMKPTHEAAVEELSQLAAEAKALPGPPKVDGKSIPTQVDWSQIQQGKPQ